MRMLMVALAVAVLLAGADTLAWRWATSRLRQGLDEWVAARRAAGWTVTHGAPDAGGWPLRATLDVPALSMTGAGSDIPGGVSWTASALSLSIDFDHPRTLHAALGGEQTLRIGTIPTIAASAASLYADIPLSPGAPPRAADVTVRDLLAWPAAASTADRAGETTSAAQVLAHFDWHPAAAQSEPAIGFTIAAEAVALPSGENWALGRRISSLSAEGSLDGPMPSGAGEGPAARAAAWRDGGGTLDLRRLAFGWGPLGVSARATLAVDDALQPMGTGSARLVGFGPALDQLAHAGVIPPGAAMAARAVLSLIARPDQAGGAEPAADVPLTLRDRVLAMRQVPLLRIPPLVWPAP
jgi:hypothetical protein